MQNHSTFKDTACKPITPGLHTAHKHILFDRCSASTRVRCQWVKLEEVHKSWVPETPYSYTKHSPWYRAVAFLWHHLPHRSSPPSLFPHTQPHQSLTILALPQQLPSAIPQHPHSYCLPGINRLSWIIRIRYFMASSSHTLEPLRSQSHLNLNFMIYC